MVQTNSHRYSPSRRANHCIPDQISVALNNLMTKKEVPNVHDEDEAALEAEDLAAD